MNAAGIASSSVMRVAAAWASIALAPVTVMASDHDFGAVVGSLEHGYHLHRKYVPWIGMASFGAHLATGGAVKGIKIAEFEETSLSSPKTGAVLVDLPEVVKEALGASWSLIVASRSRTEGEEREQTAIFVRPHGARMTLLVASFDREEMSVVRLDMNGPQFARWLEKPGQHLHPEVTD